MKASQSDLSDWPAMVQSARRADLLRSGPINMHPGIQCTWTEEERWIYLATLRVPPEVRGNGHASFLIDKLKARARELGKNGIRLMFSPDAGEEDNVRRFYKRRGFHFLADNETMVWRL